MKAEQPEHKGKKNISVKSAISIFLLFVGAKTAIVPFEDPRYTIAAVNALSGGIAQCESKEAPKSKEYPYDAIMVLGGGSIKTDDTYKLSEETETRLHAGAIALLKGMSDKIYYIWKVKSG